MYKIKKCIHRNEYQFKYIYKYIYAVMCIYIYNMNIINYLNSRRKYHKKSYYIILNENIIYIYRYKYIYIY